MLHNEELHDLWQFLILLSYESQAN